MLCLLPNAAEVESPYRLQNVVVRLKHPDQDEAAPDADRDAAEAADLAVKEIAEHAVAARHSAALPDVVVAELPDAAQAEQEPRHAAVPAQLAWAHCCEPTNPNGRWSMAHQMTRLGCQLPNRCR